MDKRRETGIEERGLSLRISFMWKGIQCRETLKLKPDDKNIKYAVKLRAEILRKIEVNTFSYSDYFPDSPKAKIGKVVIPTLKEASERYLNSSSELAKSSFVTYKKHLNKHWLPFFGERRLDEITYSEILEHLSMIDIGPKTRNNVIIPFRRILEIAYIDGTIKVNPANRIKNIKVQKTPPDPLLLGEVELVLAHMKKTYSEYIYNYFEFAIFSGLRTSELIELHWGDVEEGKVIISRSRVEGESKGTKTSQVRVLELNKRAKEALARQAKHTKLKRGHVFLNPLTNMPWNDQRSQNSVYWIPSLIAVKLHTRNAYQTRHTFATLMLMSGVNPMWVARQMGHNSMKMLLEVYSRWIDLSDKSRELDKVNNLLFGEISPNIAKFN